MPTIAILTFIIAQALAALWPDKTFEIKPHIRKTDGRIYKWEIIWTFSAAIKKGAEPTPQRKHWLTLRPFSTDGPCKYADRSKFIAEVEKGLKEAQQTRGIANGTEWDLWTIDSTKANPPASTEPEALTPKSDAKANAKSNRPAAPAPAPDPATPSPLDTVPSVVPAVDSSDEQ